MLARMSVTVRRLVQGEEALTEAFLATEPDTTLFLRSNLSRAGLVDDGAQFSGTYAGAFEENRLVGVAAIYWNDNIVVAPGPHAEALAEHAVELSGPGRRIGGILGPHDEVVRVRRALRLDGATARFTSKEILYSLALEELVIPTALANGELIARLAERGEMDTLMDWRMEYCAETSNMPDTEQTRTDQRRSLDAYQAKGHHFVVTRGVDGERVAYSAFNATAADVVQVGGVWTPRELRGRGYARCAVAGSLQDARKRGVRRAVLFTDQANVAAQKAYASIGFEAVGNYGIVFFAA
jgi:ribosomal protein S18 acetylase RimI-like enzyme